MIDESNQEQPPELQDRQQGRQRLANLVGRLLAHFWIRRETAEFSGTETDAESGPFNPVERKQKQGISGP